MKSIYACALLKVKNQRAAAVQDDLKALSAVGFMFPTTGRADLVAFIYADDPKLMGSVLIDQLQANPSITSIETLIMIGQIDSMEWATQAARNGVIGCVLIDVEGGALARVGQQIGDLKQVLFVAPTVGVVDIVALVHAESLSELGAMVATVQGVDGVRRTETMIALGALTVQHWASET
ncbi:MAG: Lrp/AsnC ligand binding domain-containing protein [Chloroflexota bacterium]|nr:Lrp/AsnC ligand binding domain-containing protein [Chloroflexota bacterium]